MKISVLVGTRNRAEALLRCLDSVARQSPPPHEVLVLDDASDALRVDELLRERGVRGVRVLRSERPLGVAAGRNVLLREATGDVGFVLDDDAYFDEPSALARVADVMRRHPKAGVVAVRIIDHRATGDVDLIPASRQGRRALAAATRGEIHVSYFLGGAHAMRREVYDTLRGYDESFVFGEEELDLSYRAIQAGYDILYVPDVVVHHRAMPSVLGNEPSRRELFYHARNRLYLARRYLPARYVVPYLAAWLATNTLMALRRGQLVDMVQGLVSGVRTVGRQPREPLQGAALSYMHRHHGRLWF